MATSPVLLAILFAFSAHDVCAVAVQNATSSIASEMSPVRKVVTLIEEMKAQVEKDASEDLAAYDKYMCWCETNDKEKTAAITAAEARISELTAFLEEAAAKVGELKTQIASLANDIAEDQDALASAVAAREKEFEAFLAEDADMKETRGLLAEAIEVLSKVQLAQTGAKATTPEASRARAVLLQLRDKVQGQPSRFQAVMQRDLFDVFGSLEDVAAHGKGGFLPRRTGLISEIPKPDLSSDKLLPWEKTEEQIGMEAKPSGLEGAASGAKSYNARSGGVVGLLKEMSDQFTADLSSSQKEDFQAEVSFQNLRAAKLGEIEAATKSKNAKEADLADTQAKAAQAKEDKAATTAALEADQGFLVNMKKDCQSEDEQYKARSKTRSEELVALAETLKILSEDMSRDLFGKTVTLLQISGSAGKKAVSYSAERAAAEDRAVERVMQRLAVVARRNKNWALASLAVRVRLDAFTKVKEVMDKMLVELQKQQKEEYEKREFCNKAIDQTEDEIKVGMNTKEDLDEKHTFLVNTLEELARDIEALKKDEAEMVVSLKQAGEMRKQENEVYQTSITDQRATTNILNKALKRLQLFYTPGNKTELVEVRAHSQEPGRAVAPRPDTPSDYAKSAGAGGVLQLIMKIIENSEVGEKELEMDEQRAQELYAEFVRTATATIQADRDAIAEKSALAAETEAEKSETQEAQLGNDQNLAKLGELLKAHHLDCDWLLQYFDVRQKARAEEMDAITDAKAVLSGADFGR
jgi:hypothetical protein